MQIDYGKLFQNHYRLEEHTEGVIPFRFSQKQIDYYYGVREYYGIRSSCTSGITMEFTTTARSFSFDFTAWAVVLGMLGFDVYENGEMVWSYRFVCGDEKGMRGTVEHHVKAEGCVHIEIYMPTTAKTAIRNFAIDNMEYVDNSGKLRLMTFGDSITQGMYSCYPSLTYVSILRRQLGAQLLNQAVSGDVFRPLAPDPEVDFKPDVVTVAYGTNDTKFTPDLAEAEANAKALFARIAELYGDTAVLNAITPIWRKDAEKDPAFGARHAIIRGFAAKYATENGFHVIDGYGLVPHMSDFFEDQSLHPNTMGFGIYAANLYPQLKLK